MLLLWPRIQVAAVVPEELREEAIAVCERESRCQPIGAHVNDGWAEPIMTRRAHRAGFASRFCPWHDRLGVHGPFGLSIAYTLAAMPRWAKCVPTRLWAHPAFSAWAWTLRQRRRCKVFGACTRSARRALDRGWGHTLRDRQRVAVQSMGAPSRSSDI